MALTPTALYRGTLGASTADLYTVPPSTTTVVRQIVVTNKTSTSRDVTILLDGVEIIAAAPIPGNTTVPFDLSQVLAAGKKIAGFASGASALNAHISGTQLA